MQLHFYPQAIKELIQTLRQLPGVGQRSAEKLAFAMLEWPSKQLKQFCQSIEQCKTHISQCEACGCLYDTQKSCWSCRVHERGSVCVVAYAKEAFAIHSTSSFKGFFHVLGGHIDPMHGTLPEHLRINKLIAQLQNEQTDEVLIALDATLEGDATALFLRHVIEEQVKNKRPNLKISRLAFGMPINSSLELVDSATLTRAISAKSYW